MDKTCFFVGLSHVISKMCIFVYFCCSISKLVDLIEFCIMCFDGFVGNKFFYLQFSLIKYVCACYP